jgi:predicted MFS family arabinose efflux permease
MPPPQRQKRYTPLLCAALFALVPYILVASGESLYRQQVMRDIGAGANALSVIAGLSVAGYAFGALLAGDLINRVHHRTLFIANEVLFVIGWCVVAAAPGAWTYGIGRVLAGFATGLLLVTALPPVVRGFPPGRTPFTAAFVNIGFFGAIAAGPLLGGAVAAIHAWRWLYAGFAALGVLTIVLALVWMPNEEPGDPDMPFDWHGLLLGLLATSLPFFASGELRAHGFSELIVAAPLGIGLVCFAALMIVEYFKKDALSPVQRMWTTFPVAGTIIAMAGGGAFVTFVELISQLLVRVGHRTPLAAGLQFWPQLAGALITAAALGVLFRTRYLPVLALTGMLLLIAGGGLLLLYQPGANRELLLIGVGLLGLGAGATVSPGLFMAGFSLPATILGRIFALVELVRSVADFILAPVMLKIARVAASQPGGVDAAGIHVALSITIALTVVGGTIALALLIGGGALPQPDIVAWIEHQRTAIRSPRLFATLRRQRT